MEKTLLFEPSLMRWEMMDDDRVIMSHLLDYTAIEQNNSTPEVDLVTRILNQYLVEERPTRKLLPIDS